MKETRGADCPAARSVAPKPGMVLLLTCGATFLAFLDTTVVNVAFPALRTSFPETSVATLSWVVSSYAVVLAALLTPAGRLADVVGRKRVFLVSLLLFTAASAANALAPNIEALVAARAVQGGAAAGMIPAALGLVLHETPPEKRTVAVGVWGAAASAAAAAGPTLGGVLVEVDSWRAVFLINVPLGLLLLVGGLRSLPVDRPTGRQLPDLIGTLVVTLGIGSFVAGLTEGAEWGWTSGWTISALLGGVVLTAYGLYRSRRHPAPAVEIGLWQNHTFAAANLTSLLAGIGMFAWLLSGPLFCAAVWNYSVLKAGLAVTPGAVTSAAAAIVVGKRLSPAGQRAAVPVGMLMFTVTGVWMYLGVGAEREFLEVWLPAGALGGAALGAAMTGLSTAAAMSVPGEKFATGIGLNTTARQLGGALGVAAAAVILAERGIAGPLGFREIFLFSAIAAAVAALSGLALLRREPADGGVSRWSATAVGPEVRIPQEK
ncbi:DHA2 family efflux MFS transporter permease subunit [Streptomyces sp. NPDC059010]|uniref:DHA2 family efflux MFS transporter permease subunit n=1 Tax=Streptomyces sp. NPDC059010 TaxID=3346695 RepID=UPI003697520E